jgi:hypothetical protein
VTLTPLTTVIDTVCGKNQIKLLDFTQMGLSLEQFSLSLADLTIEDCECTLRAYLALCERVGLSASRTTAAQTGWARCRARDLRHGVSIQLDDDIRALERRAIHPGRNECYRLGDIPGTTYSLDIRSCHAAICLESSLPVHCASCFPLGCPVDQVSCDSDDHWIADVVVRSATPDYPLRWGEHTIYPVGESWTTLAWPELRRALTLGHVVRITRAARYAARPALSGYAQWYLDARRRLEASEWRFMLPTLKAIYNTSLGYTARENYDWRKWDVKPMSRWYLGVARDPECGEGFVPAQILDGVPRWLRVGGEPYESIPMWFATICSYARVRLLECMETAGRSEVHYCDTDGLLCSRAGREALESQPEIMGLSPGQLCERFPPGAARIAAQKNYRVGRHYVCAGGVATRRSLIRDRIEYATPTGRTDGQGRVTPFEVWCEDTGDQTARWRNWMVDYQTR